MSFAGRSGHYRGGGRARSGRCYGRCLAVAVGPCVWLVARLRVWVVDEEIIVRAAVVGCMLCFLCVYLDAVLQLCVRPLDGGELHVTYCGPGFRGVVGDDSVKLEWYRSSEHCLLDFRLPHQAANLICRWRGRAPSGVLCDGVLRCTRGQVVVPLG